MGQSDDDGEGCVVGTGEEVWVPGEAATLDRPPFYGTLGVHPSARLGRFVQMDADGHGDLSFFDLSCGALPTHIRGAHRHLHPVEPSRLGDTLVRTRAGEVWEVNPQTETQALMSTGVDAWRLTHEHLWTLEHERVVRRERGSPVSYVGHGEAVRRFSVHERRDLEDPWNEEGQDTFMAFEDESGVHVLDLAEPFLATLVDADACEPSIDTGVLLALTPCGPDAALLVRSPASGASSYYGEGVTAAVRDEASQVILYTARGAGEVHDLYLLAPPEDPVRVAPELTLPSWFRRSGSRLYMADEGEAGWLGRWSEHGGFEVLAVGVLEVHDPIYWAHSYLPTNPYFLVSFDGEVGDLVELDLASGELHHIAGGVPPDGVRIGYDVQWVAFIDGYRGPEQGGTLRVRFNYQPDVTLRIADNVGRFEFSITHDRGDHYYPVSLDFVYTVVHPSRAGLWIGRYDWSY